MLELQHPNTRSPVSRHKMRGEPAVQQVVSPQPRPGQAQVLPQPSGEPRQDVRRAHIGKKPDHWNRSVVTISVVPGFSLLRQNQIKNRKISRDRTAGSESCLGEGVGALSRRSVARATALQEGTVPCGSIAHEATPGRHKKAMPCQDARQISATLERPKNHARMHGNQCNS